MADKNKDFDSRRIELAADPYRPHYHFLPPANWMNDPNGAIFWKGKYHLFYQYNPHGAFHGTMHWGHTVSEDLVSWKDLPIALSLNPGEPDEGGCYSGGAFNNDGVPTFIYYGKDAGNCLATGDDDLINWKKHPANPVIPHPPKGQEEWEPFDPFAWKEGDTWYSLSGGSVEGSGDAAFLFKSNDLIHWDYLHSLYEGIEGKPPESDCAVPDFFKLGEKHVLLFSSHSRGPQYYIGTYRDHRYTIEKHGRMNYGDFSLDSGNLSAVITLKDDLGRRILFGWIAEARQDRIQREAGWAGIMTLPRLLSLDDNGNLRIEPVPELNQLRREHQSYTNLQVLPDTKDLINEVKGECLEINAEFEMSDAKEFGILVRCSPDRNEYTRIAYNHYDECLELDPEWSSLSKVIRNRSIQRGPFKLQAGERLNLRIYLDRSVIEVFANDRQCLTKRIYPTRSDSLGLDLYSKGGSAQVRALDIWRMAAIWPTAKTRPDLDCRVL